MRTERGPTILLSLIAILTLGALGVLTMEDSLSDRRTPKAEEFQRLVGGLGFGPALDLSRCAFSFDPRLCCGCPQDGGPIPGGFSFCPEHACSIWYYPQPTTCGGLSTETSGDAPVP
jgi:hypothetical protein